MRPAARSARGFTLVELAAAVAVASVLLAMLAVNAADARRNGQAAGSIANLKQFGAVTANYAQDHADRVWGFTWTGPNPLDAAANQAVDIMRRRGDPTMPLLTPWIPHIMYSPLVLADYLDLDLPAPFFASPGDRFLLQWQADPATLPDGDSNRRLRFSSSYELPPAFYSPDARVDNVDTISQGNTHSTFLIPGSTPLGPRSLSDVRHPSLKALMYERFQRFYGPRDAFFGHQQARFPVLAVDGAATTRANRDINRGFFPNNPQSPAAPTYAYSPASYEPPALSGSSDLVFGSARWTRSGLRGRDWGGPELPWTP